MTKTVKLYRVDPDGQRRAAGLLRSTSAGDDLPARWELFLATAAPGLYIAVYRGATLGMAHGERPAGGPPAATPAHRRP